MNKIDVELSNVEGKMSEPSENDLLRENSGGGDGGSVITNRTYRTINDIDVDSTRPMTSTGATSRTNILNGSNNNVNSNSNNINNETDVELDVKIINPNGRPATAEHARLENLNEQNLEELEEEIELKYGAQHVIKLFIPVTICLFFVILSLSFIKSYQKSDGATLIYTPFNEESSDSSGTKLWMSIANASIFIVVVVVMTVVLILLYKFSCYKLIHGWLALSSLMLLFFFTFLYITELFKQFNIVADMFTIMFFLWNFGIVGMFAIHWKGPLILQQIFLIFSCVQMALVFIKYLPEWTTWILLAFISIWDLIAVLCPFGPLRILVETAKSRNDNLFPSMVYSSAIMYTLVAGMANNAEETNSQRSPHASQMSVNNPNYVGSSNQNDLLDSDEGGFRDSNNTQTERRLTSTNSGATDSLHHRNTNNRVTNNSNSANNRNRSSRTIEHIEQLEHQQQEEQENGVKLGLGDFIFYSILVGKASILGDWNTVIACFIAILIGLCFTLVLLAIFHKPLPALPISLFFGLIFYFSTNLIVRPFYDYLTYQQVFI